MIIPSFKGINNRLDDTRLPMPSKEDPRLPLRNAVNVDIGSDGQVIFPGWGTTQAVSATDAHSWYEYDDAYGYGLFVDNGSLKRLNSDNTATTLATVQNLPMSYAALEDRLYYSNGIDSGIYENGTVKAWGIPNPPRQPDATAIPAGGLYGGEYRIAITWLVGSGERYLESGTFESVQVTVPDGGGIHLDNFPTPPADIDKIAIYVSSVNSEDLYLYDIDMDRYPAGVQDVFIRYHIGAIPLESQFAVKPEPGVCLTVHNGGIFWIDGNRVRYTEPHAVHLYRAGNYFDLEHEVLSLVSIKTGPLYVQSINGLYAINGIYSPEGPALPKKLRTYNGCKLHNVAYHPDNNEAAIWTDAGFVRVTAEGVQDLNLNEFAAPSFLVGSIAYQEQNGFMKLVFVGRGGAISRSQHPDYTAAETARSGRAF
jgi:hypothetical protein